jgi:hypothetical protein
VNVNGKFHLFLYYLLTVHSLTLSLHVSSVSHLVLVFLILVMLSWYVLVFVCHA